jgi:integrase
MGSVDRRPSGRYRARHREHPCGPQKSRSFVKKADAQRFLTQVEHQLLTGTHSPRSAGQITLADYATEYCSRRHWRAQTADRKERELRIHVLPALGSIPLANLTRARIETWAAGLDLAPSSVHTVHATLSAILNAAVSDGRIPRNPAAGAHLPPVIDAPVRILEPAEIGALADEVPEAFRAAVIVAAGTGLRQGELFGLTKCNIDWLHQTLQVRQQLISPSSGLPVLAPVKSKNSNRCIGLSLVTLDALARHLSRYGTGPNDVVFHLNGRYVSRSAGSKLLTRAGLSVGLSNVGWHDLRHFKASTLLSHGVNPAYVAERMGHDVATLLRTYSHSLPRDDDRVRALVDDQLGGLGGKPLTTTLRYVPALVARDGEV